MNVGIGSFFASSASRDVPIDDAVPWAGTDTVYVQSGRQALRLLSELLWSQGYRRLILPGHLCASMIEPFETRDWTVRFSPMTDRLRVDPGSYDALCLDRPDETVALIAEYFGRNVTEQTTAAVARWKDEGVAVIDDRTHNLFDRERSEATYAFGSLRKLLPVGDGCFVQGLDDAPAFGQQAVDPSRASWTAMDLKAAAGTQSGSLHETYRAAESEFAVATEPAAMSSRSHEELRHLNFTAMSAARSSNFMTLLDRVQHLMVVNDDLDGGTPAYLVLRTPEAETLQGMLAERGVFCPIHWPRPSQVPPERPWRDDLISVPIDHRYGHQEMEYIGQTLNEVAKRAH